MPQNDNKPDVIPAKKRKLDLGLSKREWGEALAGQGAALADELTTERILHHGGYEADPLARPLTKLPEPAYIAIGQAATAGLTWAAHKMKQSRHKFVRAIGDIAQDVQIGANAGNAIRNSQLSVPQVSEPTPTIRPPVRPVTPPHAENMLDPHPHPILRQVGGFSNDPPTALLTKLQNHISDMGTPDLADVARKFNITKDDNAATAALKLHQALGSASPATA